ncbi:MAG: hypothetical protein A2W31_15625 [Planctomycetes bacterium RBG_16_64_10]|nr:MAG: hypothetical protein A2W31_15625 [Planctomycetes bacterium RBG_16_64_10]
MAGSVLILLAVTLVQRTIGFGRGLLFCRWLDPLELGQWELALSFLLIAAPLVVVGLPGSFGRYVEHYRRRGQLRTFLYRTTVWTVLLSLLAVGTMLGAAPWFSLLVFGHRQGTALVMLMALSLGPIVMHHFLMSLFAALRMFRIVAGMQFVQSLVFAVLGIVLLLTWRFSAASIVIAYGGASLIASAWAIVLRMGRVLADLPAPSGPLPHAHFWAKLLRFSVWVWVTNLLANLFMVVDRYMIIHVSGLETSRALAEMGQYHSSRIVPLLLVSIAELFAALLTPYLSRDCEAGRWQRVSARLNLALKLVALGMLVASVVILSLARPLFDWVLNGKFAGGEAILPWALAYCSLFGVAAVAQNYLWCAEKARLGSLALLAGLVSNVALNLVLLPRFGLMGAVLATTAANMVALVLGLRLNQAAGMTIDRGTWFLCTAPVVLGLGLWPALALLAGVALTLLTSDLLVSQSEKDQLRAVAARYAPYVMRRRPQPTTLPVAE